MTTVSARLMTDPQQAAYHAAYRRFDAGVQEVVDMPSATVFMLRQFLTKGGGRLAAYARANAFAARTDAEVVRIEHLVADRQQG